jgi:hypothetical protein
MFVLMIGIVLVVRMRVDRAIRMLVFVRVKDDLEPAAISLGDPLQRRQTWHVIAAFQARDRRLRHLQPGRRLALRLASGDAQRQKLLRALAGEHRVVIAGRAVASRTGMKGCH